MRRTLESELQVFQTLRISHLTDFSVPLHSQHVQQAVADCGAFEILQLVVSSANHAAVELLNARIVFQWLVGHGTG